MLGIGQHAKREGGGIIGPLLTAVEAHLVGGSCLAGDTCLQDGVSVHLGRARHGIERDDARLGRYLLRAPLSKQNGQENGRYCK